MVSGSVDKSIIVWDLIEGKRIYTLVGHDGTVNSLALTLDGHFFVSGSDDGSVCVWDIINRMRVFNFNGHTLFVNAILRANQDFLSLSADSGIGRLEMASGSFQVNLFLKPFNFEFVEFSNESRLIGYGSQDEAAVWDLEREADISVLLAHKFDVTSVEISRDGKFALTCSIDYQINLVYWDLVRNQKLAELNGHTSCVFCANFSKNGLSAASGSADMTVRIWDLRKLKQEFEFKGHTGSVYSIKFMNDKNLLVSAGNDEKVMVWNLSDKTIFSVLSGHNNYIWRVLVTNDDQFIISGDYLDGIRIWNVENKEQVLLFSFQKQAAIWLEQHKIGLDLVRRFIKAWIFSNSFKICLK